MSERNLEIYEARWSEALAAVDTVVESGPRDLSRAVHAVHRLSRRRQIAGPPIFEAFGLTPQDISLALQRYNRAFMADTVIDHCDGVDLVIELGTGWGYNLFNIWLRGGPDAPYVGLELAETGCVAGRRLAAAFAEPAIGFAQYDFTRPVLPPLPAARHLMALTAHAADKVAEIPRQAIEQLLAAAPKLTVIHFEALAAQLGVDAGPEGNAERERQTAKLGLNTNLMPLLRTLEGEGRLRIDEIRPVLWGGRSSMVRWSAGA